MKAFSSEWKVLAPAGCHGTATALPPTPLPLPNWPSSQLCYFVALLALFACCLLVFDKIDFLSPSSLVVVVGDVGCRTFVVRHGWVAFVAFVTAGATGTAPFCLASFSNGPTAATAHRFWPSLLGHFLATERRRAASVSCSPLCLGAF